ncbi:MAG: hypothetical protein K8R86_08400 [Bacteroidales bacterium]|nr:hypothetical protein [Bacteroidales bacterium]
MMNNFPLKKNRHIWAKMPIASILVILLFCPGINFGQSPRQKSSGVEASVSYDYLEDLKIHFQFFYSFKKHEPFIGIEFPISSDPISNYGLNAGYKFYPNKNRQTFDLYFLYLLQATSRKLYSSSTINGFSLHNLLGYGFNIYIGNTIFVKHYIAAGIENSWFGAQGNFSDLSLIGSLGIGLKIKPIKSSK